MEQNISLDMYFPDQGQMTFERIEEIIHSLGLHSIDQIQITEGAGRAKYYKYTSKRWKTIKEKEQTFTWLEVGDAEQNIQVTVSRRDWAFKKVRLLIFLKVEDFHLNLDFFHKLFVGLDGIFGKIHSTSDYYLQNNDTAMIERGIDETTYFVKPCENDPDEMVVDIEKNPGYVYMHDDLPFGAHWAMWFGPAYYRYISRDALYAFQDCYMKQSLADDVLFIQLYEHVFDYDEPQSRERQWAFRKALQLDDLRTQFELALSDDSSNSVAIAIEQGEFAHGGVRKITYYYNEQKQLVPADEASYYRTIECDEEGLLLWKEEGLLHTDVSLGRSEV